MVQFIRKKEEKKQPKTYKVGQCFVNQDGDLIMLCWMDGKGNFLQILSGGCVGCTLQGSSYSFKCNEEYELSQEQFENLYNKDRYTLTPIEIEIYEI